MHYREQVASLLFVVFLFASFHYGETIRCYECNSHYDERCSNPIRLHEDLKRNCDIDNHGHNYTMCRKTVQLVEDRRPVPDHRTIRTCGYVDSEWTGLCHEVGGENTGLSTTTNYCSCTTDYCNSAGVVTATLLTLFGALLLLRIY